jgi:hypothetical protein
VIVVTVLVLLTGVLVPTIDRAVRDAEVEDGRARLHRLASAFARYHVDTGHWPTLPGEQPGSVRPAFANVFASTLRCLGANIHGDAGWKGPYLEGGEQAALDPWGWPILVYSFGADYCHSGGGIAVVSGGRNGVVDSSLPAILTGCGQDDDLVELVAARL